ncbi:hypothetical protein HKBW3S03_00011 [Candidatus Hakubella thermalkaliphila]|uniref:TrpR-related protein YerC/YecD n=2 Tax=Candidatus Hakubella thermalkaliphila TaxID=2754717 RepID=A0A6V8NWL4_9ACTN|nr:YerC/YecD family TrpR-related protein [Candidatus Hakubella thermalkaliphila]MBT9170403.1 hypothetical protein [Actinomycetota bacterium]GFP18506.1 hypothetical protein HKBW3S03_00011 [Candidatus Hakubella thermalkaliphila]GFP24648.1 hypothetical protein HKBW3S25_00086 [Candidatus Hakubella thermalkaliphila]GFP30342.1 hypothetical protein HKBW3S34_01263 [Candidatus Hakubella thermalkaliphila]GFP42257.1 hypothetical protein HKBW3C_01383 [Candidatus Hakubella thermalkaliphila]
MPVDPRLKNKGIDELFEAILQLKNVEECYRFFEDICTVKELKAMAQRLAVAKMLEAGAKYSDISSQTGASTATISRVKRFLDFGADGYKLILERLRSEGTSQS